MSCGFAEPSVRKSPAANLLPFFDDEPSGVLHLVDALLDFLHGDRDLGTVHAHLA